MEDDGGRMWTKKEYSIMGFMGCTKHTPADTLCENITTKVWVSFGGCVSKENINNHTVNKQIFYLWIFSSFQSYKENINIGKYEHCFHCTGPTCKGYKMIFCSREKAHT